MKQLKYIVVGLLALVSVSCGRLLQTRCVCGDQLFEGSYVAHLSWDEPGERFVVGLGQPSASEFLYDYKVVDYGRNLITIQDYTLPQTAYALEVAARLGLSEQIYNDFIDYSHLMLSPDNRYALYWQGTRLTVSDLEHAVSRIIANVPIDGVLNTTWITDDKVFLEAKYPYGDGQRMLQVCLEDDCFRDLALAADEWFEGTAVSANRRFMATVSTTSNLIRIYDLSDEEAYQDVFVDFSLSPISPIWAPNDQALYVISVEWPDEAAILRVDTNGNAEVLSIIDYELASRTALWLVDETNRISIHVSYRGGLELVCWE